MMELDNFGGLSKEFANPEKASVIILPVSYDGTVTFKKGTDKGPRAIIDASRELEFYDEETEYEVYRVGIATLKELSCPCCSPSEMVNKVKEIALTWLRQKKFLVTLGGEHLLSLGVIKAHAQETKDFSILHFDAHADLRAQYEGMKYSNACVMHLAYKYAPIVSVGIRSLSKEEAEFIQTQHIPVFYACQVKDNLSEVTTQILKCLKEKVYFTIDLDCFDCGQMPSVGTPEPGGLDWYEVLKIIKAVVREKQIIGFDVMELCPQPGLVAPDFLAAKLVYKILSYIFALHTNLP